MRPAASTRQRRGMLPGTSRSLVGRGVGPGAEQSMRASDADDVVSWMRFLRIVYVSRRPTRECGWPMSTMTLWCVKWRS